jgi:hypothetical protein
MTATIIDLAAVRNARLPAKPVSAPVPATPTTEQLAKYAQDYLDLFAVPSAAQIEAFRRRHKMTRQE